MISERDETLYDPEVDYGYNKVDNGCNKADYGRNKLLTRILVDNADSIRGT